MRRTSFIIAFAFVLAIPSLGDVADGSLPGAGTFAYNGTPATDTGPAAFSVSVR
ncbi:MAG: hypothetical protein ABWY18_06230 [Tardiphaga sp.]